MARIFNVTIGARDPLALGRFWSQALAFEVAAESPDLVRLASGSDVADVLVLRVENVSAGSTLHLDLAAVDPDAEVDRLVALGARPVDIGADGRALTRAANGISWFVLADPEGNEFCVGSEPRPDAGTDPRRPSPEQVHPLARRAFELLPELIELRRRLHRHPELGFDEHEAVAAVNAVLRRHLPDVETHSVAQTGLIAHRRGVVPLVALRACLDALPIDDPKLVEYASTVPGVCHACGHDAQAAAVVGAMIILGELHPEVAVAALFQPAEEIDQGALAVLDDPTYEAVLGSLRAMIGIHGHSGLDAGQFGIEPGPVMSCITTINCEVTGTGGHGAEPHLGSDAVTAAASLVLDWQVALARRTDPRASVVLSVGRIAGGATSNVIPEHVAIEATLRYLDPALRVTLQDLVEGAAAGVRARFGVDVRVELVEVVPAVVNDPSMVDLVTRAAADVLGDGHRGQIQPSLGGDDFAYYGSRCRSCYVFVGERQQNREPYGWHNPSYDIEETSIAYAAAVLAASAVLLDPPC